MPSELDRAQRYFRLCAGQGIAACQYRLGRLLLDTPNRRERDFIQALAWFELAAEQGLQAAKNVAEKEAATLTPAQVKWVSTLKPQLIHKQE